MSEKKEKEMGWLELFYGDHWAKRRKLIIARFFLPLFFSILIYVECSCLRSCIYNEPSDLKLLFLEITTAIGRIPLLALSLILLCAFFFLQIYFAVRLHYLEPALRATWNEIFVEQKLNPRMVLIKNTFATLIGFIGKFFHFIVLSSVYLILFIPGIIVGFLAWSYFNLFSLPKIVDFVSLIPTIGDTLQEILAFIVDAWGRQISEILANLTPIYGALILAIPIILFLPLANRIETRILRKRRGNIRHVLKDGAYFLISNLNLPSKLAHFISVTLLCSFTDHSEVSIDIPIMNDRNVDQAMQSLLGLNQKCYIVRLPPFNPFRIQQELENLPQPIKDDLSKLLEREFAKLGGRVIKRIIELTKTSQYARKKLERSLIKVRKLAEQTITICGIGENGVFAYAIVRKPPPEYMTRIVTALRCSDPNVKAKILAKIEELETL
jgi:hypothetical protein